MYVCGEGEGGREKSKTYYLIGPLIEEIKYFISVGGWYSC